MEVAFIVYIVSTICIILITILYTYRHNKKKLYNKHFFNQEQVLFYVPKKIFQLIPDKNNICKEFRENINYIKKMNPDWKYTLYDDNDIVDYIKDNYNIDILHYYNKINPKYGAARADFFRYLLMYKEGGVYFDIKSATTIPLNKIILPDDEYILSYWDIPKQTNILNNCYGEFQQWFIITKPEHPFLYNTIIEVMKNIDNYKIHETGTGKLAVLKVTGPIAYTRAILPIINKYNHRIVEFNDFIGLTYNNIKKSHKKLYSKTHYSQINEPVIL